ncbi:SOS response-associated peptidase family protein [Pseudomonas nitroreducens]|uniref:SOS response-associated peptidase family protein n=1 Tax=Pseudomonas nitroreducens TaxID=46680 RepID=A0ABS0KID2_PSENT|nr:SOS response-associated peptidase family protein [Pseudomonas nitroreducens]MBG6287824.1 SOS response-associated peptidase family protein [Pseudomonas nitroreducens]
MCSRYEAPTATQLLDVFGGAPKDPTKTELRPGYRGPFIRAALNGEGLEAHAGVFGLLPFWAPDDKLARRTYNARLETVASKPSYRDAWKHSRHCIIPATAIYQPDWRSGKVLRFREHSAEPADMLFRRLGAGAPGQPAYRPQAALSNAGPGRCLSTSWSQTDE